MNELKEKEKKVETTTNEHFEKINKLEPALGKTTDELTSKISGLEEDILE